MGVLENLNKMRSESTEHENARRNLAKTPAPSILKDLIDGYTGSNDSSLRTAIREGLIDQLKATSSNPRDVRKY